MKNRTTHSAIGFGRSATLIVALLAIMSLVLSACAEEDDDGSVAMARATWDSGYMQAAINAQLIAELGYTVSDPADSTLDPNGFYPALDSGQYDLWVNGWFPLHEFYLEDERVSGLSVDRDIEPVGYQVRSGALQGYMIDKATADAEGITSMNQLANASVAQLFDHDGDGLADLIGCNAGWGCKETIDTHISEHGWGDNVEQISGDYNELVSGVRDRVAAGEPTLFYAWTPNWTYKVLTPGDDVVWLETDALDDEEGTTEVTGLRGCASDPCDLGWAVSSIRAVGNKDFLDDHPDIRSLLEVVSIPLSDIAEQNARMADSDGYSEEEIQADAAAWIEANRSTVDGWLGMAQG